MKGIKKLFFGLILMTLIGVGFKVDAKAAAEMSLEIKPPSNWGATDADFVVTLLDIDNAFFPDEDGAFIYNFKVVNDANVEQVLGQVEVQLITYESKTKNKVRIESVDNEFASQLDIITNNNTKSSVAISRATVKSFVESYGTETSGVKTVKLRAFLDGDPQKKGSATNTPVGVKADTKTVSVYKVTAAATGVGSSSVSFSGLDDPYLLPGESINSVAVTTSLAKEVAAGSNVYKFNNWTDTQSALNINDLNTTPLPSCKITMKTGTDASATTLNANYSSTATVTFNPAISTANDQLERGETSASTRTIASAYGSGDISSVNLGDVTLDTTQWSWTTGNNFTYTVPSGVQDGTNRLLITMKDGNAFYVDMTVKPNTATVNMNTVKVTKGQKVKLSRYITDANPTTKAVSVSTTGYNYVTVSPLSGQAGRIDVTGSKVTTETEGMTVNGTARKVIVYDIPNIITNDSSSGATELGSTSSKNTYSSAFKIEVPTSDYHEELFETYAGGWDGINTARIDFTGSRGTESTVTSLSGSGSLGTKEISSTDLFSVLEKACKGSKDDVTITVYPLPKDSKNYKDADLLVKYTTTVTAYRIELDTSGGAKYKINGTDQSDDFYALKGTKFTIASSAKNSGERFQKWDNSNNDNFSTESDSFTASGSKTFKAIYNNGSSSSSSSSSSSGRNAATAGEGMDDYDDVPKTGESKADIWILWSVLFIAILGAGFMIWKRFGLVRAIAEADEEVAVAEHKEEVKAKKKEKEDKIKMLKDLRNL